MYEETTSKHSSTMNIVQLSYLNHLRKIRTASLPHDSVRLIYPILESIHQICLSGILDFKDVHRLLLLRRDLWSSVQGKEYTMDLIIVVARRLLQWVASEAKCSVLEESTIDLQLLSELCQDLSLALSLSSIEVSDLLWKSTCTLTLVDKSLWI